LFKYVVYSSHNPPENLVIFLHGYNGNIADHKYATDFLRHKLRSSVLIIPEAPEICDKNPEKKQWFGMKKHDSENIRMLKKTSVPQIFAIYQKAAPKISERAKEINDFIDQLQRFYKIAEQQTYLIGFSQGAMLALYAGLSRRSSLAGVFSLSGLIAARNALDGKIKSQPPLYLFHGTDDLKVQYKTLASTRLWLKRRNITCKTFVYPGLAHKIIPEEIKEIAEIINNNTVPNPAKTISPDDEFLNSGRNKTEK